MHRLEYVEQYVKIIPEFSLHSHKNPIQDILSRILPFNSVLLLETVGATFLLSEIIIVKGSLINCPQVCSEGQNWDDLKITVLN